MMNTSLRTLSLLLSLAALASSGCATVTDDTALSSVGVTARSTCALDLHVFTSDAAGFDTHTYWVDTGREVVVFDAQFTEASARGALAAIRAATASPVRWVVITHPNPDKFNGASVFQAAGARVIASKATAAAIPGVHAYKRRYFVDVTRTFAPDAYPREARVDVTFTGKLVLPLEGDARIELHELQNPGVASTQTVAWMPATRALVVGDLVHVGTHAWLEGGIVEGAPRPDLARWKAALEELAAFPGARVYGGRGGSAPVGEAIEAQRAYLDGMEALVRAYLATLVEPKTILSGPQASSVYKAIADRARAAFPERDLVYLVEYGVYGLANAVAAASR